MLKGRVQATKREMQNACHLLRIENQLPVTTLDCGLSFSNPQMGDESVKTATSNYVAVICYSLSSLASHDMRTFVWSRLFVRFHLLSLAS